MTKVVNAGMGLDNLGVRGVDHTHMFPVLLPRNHALLLLKIVVCYLLIRLAHSPNASFQNLICVKIYQEGKCYPLHISEQWNLAGAQ